MAVRHAAPRLARPAGRDVGCPRPACQPARRPPVDPGQPGDRSGGQSGSPPSLPVSSLR
jgi:hypothetical protein